MEQREKINKKLGIDSLYFDKQREQAANLGLIEAGLRIAGGTSANPLENISAGAIPALEQYNKAIAAADAGTRAELISARDAFIEEQSEIRKIQSDLFSDFFESEGMKAAAKGDVAVKAFDKALEYMGYFVKDGAVQTFFQNQPQLAATTFQKINKVVFDAFNESRAVNTNEIRDIMLKTGWSN
jgi:hypothetical protein